MSDPNTQVEFACNRLFPNRPLEIGEIEHYFENADELDYVMYSSNIDEHEEIIIIAGTQSIHLEYHDSMDIWLGPHNANIKWEDYPRCETPTGVADFISRGGWSFLEL